ncbi:MAG: tRNA (guanosine(46)-N7)-methyltransferase TrmB [Spirochaetales bacterium]|nr:tRNA (guanosine(46)-N7)-methyltransferase TrmB [Spirochaetales bacterium]
MSSDKNAVFPRKIRSYVTRGGRISKSQQRAFDELSDRYCIPFTPQCVDFSIFFGRTFRENAGPDIIIEVGFGMGIATAKIAQNNPKNYYICIEVFKAGIGKLLSEIRDRNLRNVRIIAHDASEVFLQMAPDASLSGIHVFFPDPWPKKRHHKRRLIKPPFLNLACAKLKPGGYFYAVSDWDSYAAEILAACNHEELLTNPYKTSGNGGYALPISWRPRTRFEEKGMNLNHAIREIFFIKI